MLIRSATPDDADAIFAFSSALALHAPVDRAHFEHQFDAALASTTSALFVAGPEGGSIGYLLGTVAPMFVYNGGMGFVQELYVDAQQRRTGVATELMSSFARFAHDQGATVIALATSRAGEFYSALGFAKCADYYKAPAGLLL
jgi:GNAT superfamily N-acetyltransferase